tara:strand:- start:383 stop:721 length:339 start_codon:yes stop_codon:yes gene_type:complete
MIWPPVKAWTSKQYISDQVYFVAINYGGKSLKRWVVLMSVLDASVVVKVPWSQLIDLNKWQCGWAENNYLNSSKSIKTKSHLKTTQCNNPSVDSGLTLPITKKIIRPWFGND